MEQQVSSGQRFLALDALRGIAAWWVVYFHVLGGMGYLAVDFFLVLSGFILVHRYWYSEKPVTTLTFINHRIARLYPLHLFTLLVFTVVHWLMYWVMPDFPDGTLFTFLQNLTMTHNIGLNPHGLTWNYPSWSVSVEFFVNILFIVLITRQTRSSVLFLLATLSLIMLYINHGNLNIHNENDYGFINGGLVRGMASFMLGIVAYRLYRYYREDTRLQRFGTALEIVCVVIALALVWSYPNRPASLDVFVPYIAVFVVALFALESGWLSRSLRRLSYLGDISYSVYLNHLVVIMVLRHLALQNGMTAETIFALTAAIVLVYSHFTHFYLEIPAGKAMRNGLQWLTTPQPVPKR